MSYPTPDEMKELRKLASESAMNALIYGTSFIRCMMDGEKVRFELLDPWQTVKRLEEPCDETDAQALAACEDLPFVEGDPYMRTPPQVKREWVDHIFGAYLKPIDHAADFMASWNAHQAAEQAERATSRYAGKWPPPKA